jgi:hypothetical protein
MDAGTNETATTPESASPKKPVLKRKPKVTTKKPTTKAAPAPAAIPTEITCLADLALAYPAHLEAIGKSAGTAASYQGDLRVALKHFGEKTKIKALTKRKILAYFCSDAVTLNRQGQPKNPITTAKLRRVFRLALTWAHEAGHLAKLDLPTKDEIEG